MLNDTSQWGSRKEVAGVGAHCRNQKVNEFKVMINVEKSRKKIIRMENTMDKYIQEKKAITHFWILHNEYLHIHYIFTTYGK